MVKDGNWAGSCRGWFRPHWSRGASGDGARSREGYEQARRDLLADAPIGSSLDKVVWVLKRQGYDSTWTVRDGVLTAIKNDALKEFTLRGGPVIWQLRVYCHFSEDKLTEVDTDMWPDSL